MSKRDWYAVLFLLIILIFGAADKYDYWAIAFIPTVIAGSYLLYKIAPKDKPKD